MPVYICRWPNGDFSVVSAVSKDHAIELLDEVGNAEGCPMTTIKDFMIHFALKDSGELEFQSYGEATESRIMRWGYPLLDRALVETVSSDVVEAGKRNAVQQAVAAERERVVHKVKEPDTELGKRIKGLTDAPAGKINKIVRDEARKSLDQFRGKGKPQ